MVFPSPPSLPDSLQIATAGEALIDLIEEPDGRLRPCAGGAVYNLTRALGLQGVGTLYLNPLSDDRFGRLLAQGLHDAAVQLAQPGPRTEPTSLAVVGLDAEGKARYSFYREGVADRQVTAAALMAACAAAPGLRIVATGCLALVPEDAHRYQPWLQAQRSAGRLVVVDANLRPAIVPDTAAYRASVLQALEQAHIVKVSDDDLQLLGFTQPDPVDGARALLARTPADWVALTLGAQGAVLLHRQGRGWRTQESTPVRVADTVGAGDSFLAGLLAALLDRVGPQDALPERCARLSPDDAVHILEHALSSASLCVQETGCVPPSHTAVRSRLASVQRHTVAA